MSGTPVSANKPVLAALVTAGVVVGLIPCALLNGVELYLPLFALAAAPVAWTTMRSFESRATVAPTLGEMLLGAWGSVGLGTVASMFGLLAYLVVWLVGRLAGLKAGGAAFWVSLMVAGVLGLGTAAGAAEELPRKLYPSSAGASSPFYPLLVERRRLVVWTLVSVIVLAVLIAFFEPHGWKLSTSLLLFLLFTSVPVARLGDEEERSPDKTRAVDAVARALASAGLNVIPSPRTGREDIDPLVTVVDLLAQDEKRTLAVEVKEGAHDSSPIDWQEGAALRLAAAALQKAMSETGSGVNVKPLMLLVERPRSDGLRLFLASGDVDVRDVPAEAIRDAGAGAAELARLASLILEDREMASPKVAGV